MCWCKSSPVTAQAEVGTQGIFASVLLEAATDYRDYSEVCHKLISYLGGMECAITNTTRKHRPIIFWPLLCVLDIIYFSYFNHFSPRGLACYVHLYSASHCWVYIYIILSGNCHCSTRSFWPWKCWCVLNASVPFTVQGPHWGDVNVELMCHFNRASPSVVGMCITGVFLAAICWSGHTLHISLCLFILCQISACQNKWFLMPDGQRATFGNLLCVEYTADRWKVGFTKCIAMTLPSGRLFHFNDLANTVIYFSSILGIKVHFETAFMPGSA